MIIAKIGFALQIVWIAWQACEALRHPQTHHTCKLSNQLHANCSYKHLSKVPSGLDKRTTTLTLKGNSLTTLKAKAFQSTLNLTALILGHNRLKSLDEQAFVGLKRLIELDLSYNHIGALGAKLFGKDLSTLHQLRLEYNNLTRITQNVFDNLKNLKVLHLEHNKLVSIHKHSFNKFHVISYLSIDHNYLTNVSLHWFRPINNSLTHVALRHNPWICDNRTCAYRTWIGTIRKHDNEDSTKLFNALNIICCHGRSNTTLWSIDSYALCDSSGHHDEHVTVSPNSVATLKCKDTTSTAWNILTMRKGHGSACHVHVKDSNEKLKVLPGEIKIHDAQKSNSGRYCCSAKSKKTAKCFRVKVTTKAPAGGGSGATAIIIIIVIVVVLGSVFYVCRRKRRKYGVLRDEGNTAASNSGRLAESSNLSQHPSSTVESSEIGEAYV